MKHIILVLAATLLSAGVLAADDGLRVRYLDPTGKMSFTLNQDIDVGERKSIATREFSFDLTLRGDPQAEAVSVTIDKARGSYTAHDMKQRLGTRHLPEQSFRLSISEEGRLLARDESSDALLIKLGQFPSRGYSIAGQMADTLPVLPEKAVILGTTWETDREVHSLEGWGWGVGRMTSRHRITAVDPGNDRTVVSVTTVANATLGPVEDQEAFHAELKRTLHWTFDATSGRLLTMSMEQEAEGTCVVPQGEVQFIQHTRLELTPSS